MTTQQDDEPKHVDAARIAAILSVTRETVYRKARTGDIPAVRVGRLYRFVIAEVLEALRPAPAGSWHQSRRSTSRRRGPREP